MVGPAMDLLSNPLGAVRILFERSCGQSPSIQDLRSDWGVKELVDSFLYQQGGFQQVPEINSTLLSEIPTNGLVRYRGMVQDMLDVEYYLGAYKDGMTWRTTKFTDATDLAIDYKSPNHVWDRRLLYCVPVPGENNWVSEAFADSSSSALLAIREIPQTEEEPLASEGCSDVEMEVQFVAAEGCSDVEMEVKFVATTESKRQRLEMRSSLMGGTSQTLDLNMPLGESSLLPCLVKVYDGADANIRLNDVVEFTGVLSFDPTLSTTTSSHGDVPLDSSLNPFMEEDACSQLPASRVPRLHCISCRKLSPHKILDALPNPAEMNLGLKATPETILQLRGSILKCLKDVLGGDQLTAEYLLLHVLSQVHHRVDSTALGKISLNIVTGNSTVGHVPSPLAIAVSQSIQNLLPYSHLLPLSLHNLNKALMAPQKDYTTNRLVTGCLQLANGTYLILDETVLTTGQLTSIGINNIQSLKYLMEWQKVEYDFEYYKLDMQADIPVLIISHARSRLLPADVVVPIQPTAAFSSVSVESPEISSWRFYLNAVRNMEHTLDLSMKQHVQDELVDARQHDRSITPETFHRWLTLARLLSLSYGESSLSLERWQSVREMERLCAERVTCLEK